MKRTARPLWLRVLGMILVICTLAWAILLLARGWEGVDVASLSPAPWPSAVAFLLATLSLTMVLPAFWWLLSSSGASPPPLLELSRLHFVSQLMRHLPGRFIGVAYQVAMARHLATATQWMGANGTHMAMAVWFASALPLAFLALAGEVEPRVGAFALATLVIGPVAMVPVLSRMASWHMPVRYLQWPVETAAAVASCVGSRGFWHAMAWFAASWVVYGAAWAVLGTSLAGIGPWEGLVLCAFYSLAWVVGFLSMVTPSGLGVRELAFAALAKDLPPEVVAYVAIVARLGLLCGDLVLGLVFLWIGRKKNG